MNRGVRRRIGVVSGLVVGAAVVMFLNLPGRERFHAPGPMNTGHATLACESCHQPAAGSIRQQLQTVARQWIGVEAAAVDLGFQQVTNDRCLACHERPDDRHPVFRFLEPRFAEARQQLRPEECSSCHREHAGVRVTLREGTYCASCHRDTKLENDPIDVPHRDLIANERWETCLGCHDFHGNHAQRAPHRLQDALTVDQVRTYFGGGASPYGPAIRRATNPGVKTL